MHCPFCHFADTKVIDSRLASEGDKVRRRRECLRCGERFTTYECAERNLPRVVKRDGSREAFDEEKLCKGITLACEKRPVAANVIDTMVNRVSHRALGVGEQEISVKMIGEWAMRELRAVDQVAYVRFASVYRNFEDVQEFRDIIERVENDLTPEMIENQLTLISDDFDKSTH